jgi:hypothetical protein
MMDDRSGMNKMMRLLMTVAIYGFVVFAYREIVQFIYADWFASGQSIPALDRSFVVVFGCMWTMVGGLLLELHHSKQGIRDDIIDIVEDFWKSKPKLRLKERLSRTKADEIIPGVTRPTTIFAHMMAGAILRSPEKLSGDHTSWELTWEDDDRGMSVRFHRNRSDRTMTVSSCQVTMNKTSVPMDQTETALIYDAAIKALDLKIKRDAADRETKRQNHAIKGIEAFMSIDENIDG